ncbi:hypothetical protein ACIQC0_11670 [Pseudarthrobacter sp. NPDC092419]|uniref:hypothetical protein n=1 Tax=Pseudarthrobacter sp. NPDC092419 TaxID=3364414 RepID=UPI0037F399CF
MENADPLILNLTFLGTVGIAVVMFLVLFLLGVVTLVLAGVGRLAALVLMTLLGYRPNRESIPLVRLTGAGAATAGDLDEVSTSDDGAAAPRARRNWRSALSPQRLDPRRLKPARVKAALRSAVVHHPAVAAGHREPPALASDWAAAVAEADARAMARARAATPDIKLTVRDLPDPKVPAASVVEVAPLVESAVESSRPAGEVPRSFRKPPAPRPLAPLDTGSLVSLAGPDLPEGSLPGPRSRPKGKQPLP